MISQPALTVVRDTLPVIGSAIGDITPIFYDRMFTARPDLLRDLFNRGNQAQGEQQKALAGAIAAYASLLVSEDAPNIDAMMSRIANKHASLGITEDQYPIVYEHLFAAIGEVLGDAATPEVVDAWTEVYWDMANTLIAAERELYAEHDVEPGDVWSELKVIRRRQESPHTISLVLARPDGGRLPQARPGQYISVQVQLPDGANQIRQYSLTRATSHESWTVTIKAEPGRAEAGVPAGEVSNFIHGNVFEGDTIRCSLPYGDLVVEDAEAPLLLVSAGIGCTPILGALTTSCPRNLSAKSRSSTPISRWPPTPTGRIWRSSSPSCRAPECTTGTNSSAHGRRTKPSTKASSTSPRWTSPLTRRSTCAARPRS